MKRKCGECTACCTHLSVHSLDKRGGTPCKFIENGCSIYKTRPSECKSYKCDWIKGQFSEDDRPDKLGAIVYSIDALVDKVVMINLIRDDARDSVINLIRPVGPYVLIKADSFSAEVKIPKSYDESKAKMLTVALEIYNS